MIKLEINIKFKNLSRKKIETKRIRIKFDRKKLMQDKIEKQTT
jgi:predicted phage-related endonuclease